jgi:hypothetical protein
MVQRGASFGMTAGDARWLYPPGRRCRGRLGRQLRPDVKERARRFSAGALSRSWDGLLPLPAIPYSLFPIPYSLFPIPYSLAYRSTATTSTALAAGIATPGTERIGAGPERAMRSAEAGERRIAICSTTDASWPRAVSSWRTRSA